MVSILRCVEMMGQTSQVCKGGRLEGFSMTRSLIRSSLMQVCGDSRAHESLEDRGLNGGLQHVVRGCRFCCSRLSKHICFVVPPGSLRGANRKPGQTPPLPKPSRYQPPNPYMPKFVELTISLVLACRWYIRADDTIAC